MHLTFDVELYPPLREHEAFRREQLRTWERVLDLLDGHRVRTTCFTTGDFAAAHPDAVRRALDAGHEVGSHSMTHLPWHQAGPYRFEDEARKSKALLENLGADVKGYRAPQGHAPRGLGAMLQRLGYAYDSSVAPTYLPGHFNGIGAPRRPYRASLSDVCREDVGSPMWEVPISVTPGLPIPTGGIFLSALGPLLMKFPKLRQGHHVLYMHPHDLLDLRRWPGILPWGGLKRTAWHWRVLEHYLREAPGTDQRLVRLTTSQADARKA